MSIYSPKYGLSDGGSVDRDAIRRVLAPHVEDLERAAASANDPANADVFAGMAALGRGDPIPKDVARRVVRRAVDR